RLKLEKVFNPLEIVGISSLPFLTASLTSARRQSKFDSILSSVSVILSDVCGSITEFCRKSSLTSPPLGEAKTSSKFGDRDGLKPDEGTSLVALRSLSLGKDPH